MKAPCVCVGIPGAAAALFPNSVGFNLHLCCLRSQAKNVDPVDDAA